MVSRVCQKSSCSGHLSVSSHPAKLLMLLIPPNTAHEQMISIPRYGCKSPDRKILSGLLR